MDNLDTNRLLRIADVCNQTSLAKSTIWLWVAQEKFPRPLSLSPTVKVWRQADIDAWINSHI
jgi:prophage regulatory protein